MYPEQRSVNEKAKSVHSKSLRVPFVVQNMLHKQKRWFQARRMVVEYNEVFTETLIHSRSLKDKININ